MKKRVDDVPRKSSLMDLKGWTIKLLYALERL